LLPAYKFWAYQLWAYQLWDYQLWAYQLWACQLWDYQLWACQLWACQLNSFAISALQGNLPQASDESRCSATAAAGLVAAAVLRLSILHGALRLMLIKIDPTGHLTTHAANWAQITRINRLRLGFPRLLASESNCHGQYS